MCLQTSTGSGGSKDMIEALYLSGVHEVFRQEFPKNKAGSPRPETNKRAKDGANERCVSTMNSSK